MNEVIQHYAGIISAILFIYCIFYEKINKLIGWITKVKLIKIHMYCGIAAVILGILHSYNTILNNLMSLGTVSLIFMIIIAGTGELTKNSKVSKRRMFLYIHKISCAVCILVLFFHIASYYIMEL